MCDCGCGSREIAEDSSQSDPSMDDFKSALKHLGDSIKSVHKSSEGKKLSTEYWLDLVNLLKKAKLGVSMMELGIDDEEEIKNTHDATIKKVKPTPDGEKGEGGPRDGTETQKSDTDSKQNESADDIYDKLNHLTILLTENSFENIEGDGTELHICKNERKFTIKYDDSFYMISENYNFDLGGDDLNDVVNTFIKLSNQTETALKEDYRMSTQ